MVKVKDDIPIDLMMYALNESGTLLKISSIAVGKKKFLVVGNNILMNIIYGYAIRKVAREDSEINCLLDRKSDVLFRGSSMDKLMEMVFTEVRSVDILKPMEAMEDLEKRMPFDLSVNCADIPGAETINILATKEGGTVVFANLINNYNFFPDDHITKAGAVMQKYLGDEIDREGLAKELTDYWKGAAVIEH
jgi:hypothetical protein